MTPTIVALNLNHKSRAPLTRVERATAVQGAGLEGDRHSKPGRRRQVLIMAQEALDAFSLAPGDVREQVTVRGLDLMALAEGTRLRAGGATFELQEACAPCARMEELGEGLRAALDGRRGRFAAVLEGGTLAEGDALEVMQPA